MTRVDLVGSHIGETAPKTQSVLKCAEGCTLLVDEAYQRMPLDATRDFGKECIEKLMEAIEGGPATTSRRPAIIFAVYQGEMSHLLESNPGLERRITHSFPFEDFSNQEISEIFVIMLGKKAIKQSFVKKYSFEPDGS